MLAILEDVIPPEEFASLPRRAQVALSARCARYVKSTPDDAALIDAAISATENIASSAKLDATSTNCANLAERLDLAIERATDDLGKTALLTARAALKAAMEADEPAHDMAYQAARCAMFAWRQRNDGSLEVNANRIRHDFNRIKKLAAEQSWTDDTPVRVGIFSPLGHL